MKVLQKINIDKSYQLGEEYENDQTKLQELLDHLANFRKASLVKIINVHDGLRRLLLSEFPEVPKL